MMFIIPVFLFFLITITLLWIFQGNDKESIPQQNHSSTKSIKINFWNWKKNKKGTLFSVFGEVQNLSDETFKRVILELRTKKKNGQLLSRHNITVKNLLNGEKKFFREDLPRTGQEENGFLEVKNAIP